MITDSTSLQIGYNLSPLSYCSAGTNPFRKLFVESNSIPGRRAICDLQLFVGLSEAVKTLIITRFSYCVAWITCRESSPTAQPPATRKLPGRYRFRASVYGVPCVAM